MSGLDSWGFPTQRAKEVPFAPEDPWTCSQQSTAQVQYKPKTVAAPADARVSQQTHSSGDSRPVFDVIDLDETQTDLGPTHFGDTQHVQRRLQFSQAPSVASWVDEASQQICEPMPVSQFNSYFAKKKTYHKLRKHMKVDPQPRYVTLKTGGQLRYSTVCDPSEKENYLMCGHCSDQRLFKTLQILERHGQECPGKMQELLGSHSHVHAQKQQQQTSMQAPTTQASIPTSALAASIFNTPACTMTTPSSHPYSMSQQFVTPGQQPMFASQPQQQMFNTQSQQHMLPAPPSSQPMPSAQMSQHMPAAHMSQPMPSAHTSQPMPSAHMSQPMPSAPSQSVPPTQPTIHGQMMQEPLVMSQPAPAPPPQPVRGRVIYAPPEAVASQPSVVQGTSAPQDGERVTETVQRQAQPGYPPEAAECRRPDISVPRDNNVASGDQSAVRSEERSRSPQRRNKQDAVACGVTELSEGKIEIAKPPLGAKSCPENTTTIDAGSPLHKSSVQKKKKPKEAACAAELETSDESAVPLKKVDTNVPAKKDVVMKVAKEKVESQKNKRKRKKEKAPRPTCLPANTPVRAYSEENAFAVRDDAACDSVPKKCSSKRDRQANDEPEPRCKFPRAGDALPYANAEGYSGWFTEWRREDHFRLVGNYFCKGSQTTQVVGTSTHTQTTMAPLKEEMRSQSQHNVELSMSMPSMPSQSVDFRYLSTHSNPGSPLFAEGSPTMFDMQVHGAADMPRDDPFSPRKQRAKTRQSAFAPPCRYGDNPRVYFEDASESPFSGLRKRSNRTAVTKDFRAETTEWQLEGIPNAQEVRLVKQERPLNKLQRERSSVKSCVLKDQKLSRRHTVADNNTLPYAARYPEGRRSMVKCEARQTKTEECENDQTTKICGADAQKHYQGSPKRSLVESQSQPSSQRPMNKLQRSRMIVEDAPNSEPQPVSKPSDQRRSMALARRHTETSVDLERERLMRTHVEKIRDRQERRAVPVPMNLTPEPSISDSARSAAVSARPMNKLQRQRAESERVVDRAIHERDTTGCRVPVKPEPLDNVGPKSKCDVRMTNVHLQKKSPLQDATKISPLLKHVPPFAAANASAARSWKQAPEVPRLSAYDSFLQPGENVRQNVKCANRRSSSSGAIALAPRAPSKSHGTGGTPQIRSGSVPAPEESRLVPRIPRDTGANGGKKGAALPIDRKMTGHANKTDSVVVRREAKERIVKEEPLETVVADGLRHGTAGASHSKVHRQSTHAVKTERATIHSTEKHTKHQTKSAQHGTHSITAELYGRHMVKTERHHNHAVKKERPSSNSIKATARQGNSMQGASMKGSMVLSNVAVKKHMTKVQSSRNVRHGQRVDDRGAMQSILDRVMRAASKNKPQDLGCLQGHVRSKLRTGECTIKAPTSSSLYSAGIRSVDFSSKHQVVSKKRSRRP